MNAASKGLALTALVILSALALAQKSKAPEMPPRGESTDFQFIPFVASNKNMWQHGMLIDHARGRLWLLETQNVDPDGKKMAPIAIPVQFELNRTDYLGSYSPQEADDLWMLKYKMEHSK